MPRSRSIFSPRQRFTSLPGGSCFQSPSGCVYPGATLSTATPFGLMNLTAAGHARHGRISPELRALVRVVRRSAWFRVQRPAHRAGRGRRVLSLPRPRQRREAGRAHIGLLGPRHHLLRAAGRTVAGHARAHLDARADVTILIEIRCAGVRGAVIRPIAIDAARVAVLVAGAHGQCSPAGAQRNGRAERVRVCWTR